MSVSRQTKNLDRLTQPVRYKGRRRRALNPLSPEDLQMFRAALSDGHMLHGLRNRDLAERMFGPAPKDPTAKRRRTAHVSRLLQLLRAHGLLAKIPRSHRYRLTSKGETLMGAVIYVRYKALSKELEMAA